MNKVILIDTPVKLVREIEIDLNSLDAIYAVIGCQHIEGHRFPGSTTDWFYIDEEGALANPPLPVFMLEGFPDLISGRALVFGSHGPQEVDPEITLKEVEQRVSFAYSVDFTSTGNLRTFKSENVSFSMDIKDLLANIEQAIANLEALPIRSAPEEELLKNLKGLLRDYQGAKRSRMS